ncbi:gluconokinase [Dyella sp. GSA-30]|uniref:gluconokinase n=1 Tax=Dyella sp. GSA-30 TaxID=2994496 RepID=UPI002493392C|nr:gluconokinase [Dyella sp. GSA-30]
MRALVIMGVAGCGKSTVAAAICEQTGAMLIEGDAFHPEENVLKMRAGIPLNDGDRQGWLERLGEELARAVVTGMPAVLTCSALKRRYRDVLRAAVPGLGFVFLQLSQEVAAERVAHRPGHFMPSSLVDSQFRDLELPIGEPDVLTVCATNVLSSIVEEVIAFLDL